MSNKERLVSISLHALEVGAAIGLAYLVIWAFKVDLPEWVPAVAFSAIFKAWRTGGSRFDYVNDR